MTPLYIFDLDGTLAKIEHRRHFVEGPQKDWPAFFKACVHDEPNMPVVTTLRQLLKAGAEVWIWSGRSDEVRAETKAWLYQQGIYCPLEMRMAGDHQPDERLKGDWLDAMHPDSRARLVAIFDDRDRVVSMWRRKGVACFQVAPGNF